jgi:hypothetical protein
MSKIQCEGCEKEGLHHVHVDDPDFNLRLCSYHAAITLLSGLSLPEVLKACEAAGHTVVAQQTPAEPTAKDHRSDYTLPALDILSWDYYSTVITADKEEGEGKVVARTASGETFVMEMDAPSFRTFKSTIVRKPQRPPLGIWHTDDNLFVVIAESGAEAQKMLGYPRHPLHLWPDDKPFQMALSDSDLEGNPLTEEDKKPDSGVTFHRDGSDGTWTVRAPPAWWIAHTGEKVVLREPQP